ncbi:MAG: cell division protein FtsQ/DivIB [Paludibacteraceae bacterium]
MKKGVKAILLIVSLCVIGGYLVFASCFASKRHAKQYCTGMTICVKDSTERQFVSSRELEKLIKQQQSDPTGKILKEVSTKDIEDAIEKHPLLETVEVYKSKDGRVLIDVTQRTPYLRVIGEESYFVDTNRKIMPVGFTTASYVPVLTGRVTKKRATNDLYDFVEFLENDDFWHAQIVQINVTPNQQIELIPRVGDQVILLGKLDGYKEKLDKLETFYTSVMNKRGWLSYKEIDLRYHGQVIGRR